MSALENVVLFGSPISPFVDKVARALHVKGVSYRLHEPQSPFEFGRWNPRTGKMPVLEIAGEREYDSTFILRRLDVLVGVSYAEDLAHVRRVLMEVAEANPICLRQPEPTVLIEGYGEHAINLRFAVWATKERWQQLRNAIHEDLKRRFDQEGIEMPSPHRTVIAVPAAVIGEFGGT